MIGIIIYSIVVSIALVYFMIRYYSTAYDYSELEKKHSYIVDMYWTLKKVLKFKNRKDGKN